MIKPITQCMYCGGNIYTNPVHYKNNKPSHIKCDDDIPVKRRINKMKHGESSRVNKLTREAHLEYFDLETQLDETLTKARFLRSELEKLKKSRGFKNE